MSLVEPFRFFSVPLSFPFSALQTFLCVYRSSFPFVTFWTVGFSEALGNLILCFFVFVQVFDQVLGEGKTMNTVYSATGLKEN